MSVFELQQLQEFSNHKFVISLYDDHGRLMGFIAIHKGSSSLPAFGATRIWNYSSPIDGLKDALRLSRLMSYKSALAGLPYGGAKAVLFDTEETPNQRNEMIKQYAQHVNYLRGGFITGADAGVSESDLKHMISESRYIVGHSTDPIKFTILGVYDALQACLYEIFGNESVEGRSFAIQGLGNTGYALLKLIYKDAGRIIASDIDHKKIQRIKEEFPTVEIVSPSEIFKQNVDVYCPCAIGYAFTSNNINSLRCKVIVGSANNQLESTSIGNSLFEKGILYAPDYVVNAGGLIAVVEEYEHPVVNVRRISERVSYIKTSLKSIIFESKKQNKGTNIVADEMAEKIFNKIP